MTPEEFMNLISGTPPQETEPKTVNLNGNSESYWNATSSVGAVVEAPASTTAPQEEGKEDVLTKELTHQQKTELAAAQRDVDLAAAAKIDTGNLSSEITQMLQTGRTSPAVSPDAIATQAQNAAAQAGPKLLADSAEKVMELAAGAMALAENIVVPFAQKFSAMVPSLDKEGDLRIAVAGLASGINSLEKTPDGGTRSSANPALTTKSKDTDEYMLANNNFQTAENRNLPINIGPGLGQGIGRA